MLKDVSATPSCTICRNILYYYIICTICRWNEYTFYEPLTLSWLRWAQLNPFIFWWLNYDPQRMKTTNSSITASYLMQRKKERERWCSVVIQGAKNPEEKG